MCSLSQIKTQKSIWRRLKITAVTTTEVSTEDVPITSISGTTLRRLKVYIRATTATADETLDLSTLITGISDIEGIISSTDDGVVTSTIATWSGTTLTFKMAGVQEICILVNLSQVND